MKNAIIIHGTCDKAEYFSDKYPSLSNSHWFPWLQKQLLINNISTQTPEMPEAYSPDYEKWKREFEKFDVNSETILIGHSSGAAFLIRWLSENKVKINKLILVAPWLDPDEKRITSFFNFEIAKDIKERVAEIHLLVSSDDHDDILESVNIIQNNISAIKYHEFHGFGHFTYGHMKSDGFPELLGYILE
jgi:predicted alpha/beta hydrolase family esterase